MKKLSNNPKDWNIEKLKLKNLTWFRAVIDGYIKSGKIEKPADEEVKNLYETLTGKKSTKEQEVKNDKSK